MNLEEFGRGLLDALEQFDEETLPLGLYASDDLVKSAAHRPHFVEWKQAIVPFLKSHGAEVGYRATDSTRFGYSFYVTFGEQRLSS